ncbi:MAG: dephospho-CoA kinase, partial [Candidatus Nanoarchaeia archaeon]
MLIGLTGGIGCGKSTALVIFSKLGWQTIDADSICRQIYENNESNIKEILKKRWGEKVLTADGFIARKAIAEIVFVDKKELEWLNSIMHPEIIKRARNLQAKSKMPVIFDAPLLYEAQI